MRSRSRLRLAGATLLSSAIGWGCSCSDGGQVERLNPDLTAETTRVDFGDVQVGMKSMLELVVKNPGNFALSVTRVETASNFVSPDAEFTEEPGSFVLGPNETRSLRLGFHPLRVTAEPVVSTFTVISDAQRADGTAIRLTITVSGRGVPTGVGVEPSPLDFGAVLVGSSRTLPLVLTNRLSVPVELNTPLNGLSALIVPEPSATGRFELVTPIQPSGALTAGTLAPGQSVTVELRYTPAEAGRTDIAHWTLSNCSDPQCEFTIQLTGRGTDAALSCQPPSIDFGTLSPMDTAHRSVACTNVATATVVVTSFQLETGSSSSFHVTPAAMPTTLMPGESLTIPVDYSPTTADLQGPSPTGTLRIDSIGPRLTSLPGIRIPLSGSAAISSLDIQPPALEFGRLEVGTELSRRLLIANVGPNPLVVSSIQSADPQFTISPQNFPLLAGSATVVTVSFAPQRAGRIQSELIVASDDPIRPQARVPLGGEGLVDGPCTYEIMPAVLNFGAVEVGNQQQRSIQVSNTGPNTCLLREVALLPAAPTTSTAFQLLTTPAAEILIPPGTNYVFELQYSATRVGNDAATLSFFISDPIHPSVNVPIFAVANEPACANLGVGFDDQVTGVDVTANAIYFVGDFLHYNSTSAIHIAKTDLSCAPDVVFNAHAGFDAAPNIVIATKDGEVVVSASSGPTHFDGSANAQQTWKLRADGSANSAWNPPSAMAAAGANQILTGRALDDMVAFVTWQSVRVLDLRGAVLATGTGDVNLHALTAIGRKLILSSRSTANYNGAGGPAGVKVLDFSHTATTPGFGDLDPVFAQNAGSGAGSSCGTSVASPSGTDFVFTGTTQWSGSDYHWNGGSTSYKHLYRINLDGTPYPGWQTDFDTQGNYDVTPCGIDTQGRVYFTGQPITISGTMMTPDRLYRLNANGSFDRQFTEFSGAVNGCRILSDDRILVYGRFDAYRAQPAGHAVFIHADGTRY